jgi:CheY-like chemotaxis protein
VLVVDDNADAPRMDGFTFLAALRRDPRFAATAVIVASAKDISPAERAVLAPAAMAVMSKGEDVGRAVQDALRAHVMGAAKR